MANPITRIIISAVDRTKAAFASAKGGMSALGRSATSLKATLGAVFTGLAVAKLVGSLKQAIDRIDDVGDAAARVGTSVENFSALSYAAQLSASNTYELEDGLIKLSKALGDARSGAGPAAEAFQALRIDPAQFSDPSDALLALADRFAAMPDGVNKASLAMDIFGESGSKLIPMLNNGRAGIEALKQEAAALGVVIGDDIAAAAGQFNDNMDKLKAAGSGLGIQLANEVLPGLNEITTAMANAAKEGGIAAAALAAIKFLGTDFLSNESLSATYRLSEAQKQLNRLRADGFDEDQKRVVQLKQYIPLLQVLADNEKNVEEARSKSKAEREKQAGDLKKETAEMKKAAKERIADAEALRDALQSAFSSSLKAEADYLRQAKKLRAEANQTDAPATDDVEAQARARLDALIALMKLQREASTASLQDVQDQAEATRTLAEQIGDAATKSDILKQAKLAEATALEKAAAEEHDRAASQANMLRDAEKQAAGINTQLDAIKEPATVDIKPGAQLKETEESLQRVAHLIDYIKAAGPINVTTAQGATPGSSAEEKLRKAALQYGRR